MRTRSLLPVLALALVACGGDVSFTFRSAIDFQLDTADLDVPADYQGGGTVASIPCSGMCPTIEGVTSECVDSVCDPDPILTLVDLGVLDVSDEVEEAEGTPLSSVDTVELIEVDYEVTRNTLGVDLEPVEVFWTIDSDVAGSDLRLLAIFPATAADATPSGSGTLDPAGSRELTEFFEGGGRQLRFFARGGTDLFPGGPLPDGIFDVRVLLRLRVVGSVF
ncbi:MAG: hypothetical protein AAGH15_22575 [Myxococcota bacterium]